MSHKRPLIEDDPASPGYQGDPGAPYKPGHNAQNIFTRTSLATRADPSSSSSSSEDLPSPHPARTPLGSQTRSRRTSEDSPTDPQPLHSLPPDPQSHPSHSRNPRENRVHQPDSRSHPVSRQELFGGGSGGGGHRLGQPAEKGQELKVLKQVVKPPSGVLDEAAETAFGERGSGGGGESRAVVRGDRGHPQPLSSSSSTVQPTTTFSSAAPPAKRPKAAPGATSTPDSTSPEVRDDTASGAFSVPADTLQLLSPSGPHSPRRHSLKTILGGVAAAAGMEKKSSPKSSGEGGWSPYTTDHPGPPVAEQQSSDNTFFVWVLASFATIGGLLFGYDTGIVSGSMLLIQPYFDLSTVWEEAIVSGTIGAAAVFALIAGFLVDLIGRKKTIMIASFIFAVGAIIMAVSNSKEVLLVGRIVVGMGIGFASMSVPIYVAESAPPAIRGRLVTLNQLFITIGILLSSVIAGAFSEMKETGWRYMLGIAAAPGVFQFLGFFYLPESPRWLVSKGRDEEARRVLQRIRGRQDVDSELQEVKEAEDNKHSGFVLGQILKTPHVLKALFVGCGLQLFQQLCGINTVIYYSATILKQAGFPPSQAIWLVCVPFGVNFLATFIGLWAVERLGRKLLLIVSFVGVIIALIVLAIGFLLSIKYSPTVGGNSTVSLNGSLALNKCMTYSVCEDCVSNDKCGFCYDDNQEGSASCLLALDGDEDLFADSGRCSRGYQPLATESMKWTYGYCPTDYTWMAVLGLALFVLSFAPGLGPMPWTINSEIYPMWARGTGVSIATMVNWAFNLVVSFSFLTMLENITKYGTFFLFTGICVLGLLFTVVFVPETKNKSLEEVEELFMTPAAREKSRQSREASREVIQMDNHAFEANRL
ncbi:proton myo-inositol cotransporter-like [Babylonia areolata]|uniref:proton myo-inositol cotransporter-like n=1 Tax=Babylonia areolata TaxID=304850 RepID=UPI003FD60812